jgi:hypothetical protein
MILIPLSPEKCVFSSRFSATIKDGNGQLITDLIEKANSKFLLSFCIQLSTQNPANTVH